jgi:hypothetical protein
MFLLLLLCLLLLLLRQLLLLMLSEGNSDLVLSRGEQRHRHCQAAVASESDSRLLPPS